MKNFLKKIKRRVFKFILAQKNNPAFAKIRNKHYWSFEKENVSKAVALGLFISWQPIPFQMFPAFYFAYLIRANLIVAVAAVWWSNPLTWPIMTYLAFVTGDFFISPWFDNNLDILVLLRQQMDMAFFMNIGIAFLIPILIGGFVLSFVFGFFGYVIPYYTWELFETYWGRKAHR